MTVLEFADNTENEDATHVEVHDEWVVARIADPDGNINRYCIPSRRIKRIVAHEDGDDLTFES